MPSLLQFIIRRHLFPNSVAPSMLSQARDWMIGPGGSLLTYWRVFLQPTLAVMVFGIAWNMLGDGLSDIFDP